MAKMVYIKENGQIRTVSFYSYLDKYKERGAVLCDRFGNKISEAEASGEDPAAGAQASAEAAGSPSTSKPKSSKSDDDNA